MAFLSDITSHLNNLNIQLQGRCQTVSGLYAHMRAFRCKLALFRDGFASASPDLAHFPSCQERRRDVPECEKTSPKYRANIETLLQPFNEHFQDFHAMHPRVALFTPPPLPMSVSNPRSCSWNCVNYSRTPSFSHREMRRGFHSGDYYLSPVSRSLGIFHFLWPACLGALTSVRAAFQLSSTLNQKRETGWQMKLYSSSCKLEAQKWKLAFRILCSSRESHRYLIRTNVAEPGVGEAGYFQDLP